jgi:NAD(P)H-binding
MLGCITVFGGTGFIGRHLVSLLLQSGATVRVAVRHPGRVAVEATNTPEIVRADILEDTRVGSAIAGAEGVFNLVGILTETTMQTYRAIHVESARRVALAAQNHRLMRVTHVSALGASPTSPAISEALLELLLTVINRHRILLPIPFALAEMQAGLLELLPNPPLTRDQVRLLKTDKVVSGMEPTLEDLGMQPRSLDEFLAAFKKKYS